MFLKELQHLPKFCDKSWTSYWMKDEKKEKRKGDCVYRANTHTDTHIHKVYVIRMDGLYDYRRRTHTQRDAQGQIN